MKSSSETKALGGDKTTITAVTRCMTLVNQTSYNDYCVYTNVIEAIVKFEPLKSACSSRSSSRGTTPITGLFAAPCTLYTVILDIITVTVPT